jgi:molybdopterin-containing oxidoreductase family molybdopterin binding subunit
VNILGRDKEIAGTAEQPTVARDDAWVPSACSLCYSSCSILAHRVDGVITKIEGNPDSVVGMGRLCGKGVSGIMTHYDPHRVNKPLRRTNPEKGIGVDPGWEEISWEEALSEIAGHLKRIRADDLRKLYIMRTTTVWSMQTPYTAFVSAFGATNTSSAGGGLHCGNGAHLVGGIMHASWSVVPDFKRCNYALYFGASKGHAAGHVANTNMAEAADARVRGMKMVVVDPIANQVGAKGTEWVPIRVGTDAALALAMANVMVNELQVFDAPYIKAKTNGPYLIGPDRHYVRDAATDKPLVWDEAAGRAVPFDAAAAADMALGGIFEAEGVECQPAFALIKDHLKTYSPERAEEITTIQAATIRRLAGEFAAEARIGSSIEIDGLAIPYRPVAAIAFRGAQGHKNSAYNMLAIDLLNQLAGSADMAGGCLGFNPACDGYPETGRLEYAPHPDPDGMMITGSWVVPHAPFPIDDPKMPQKLGLQDLFPHALSSPFQGSSDQPEMWERFEFDYGPDMMINLGANQIMSVGNKDAVAASLKRFKFIVCFDLFLTETSQFADIVLPDCSYLETGDSRANFPFIFSHPAGEGEWCWPIRQPAVEAEGERRQLSEVLIELADRAGILPDLNAAFNALLDLRPPNRLSPSKRYSFAEVCDADLKDKFGPDKGLDWFKEHGVMKWPKKTKEVYWRHFVDVRVPIYWEWMPTIWEKANAIAEPRGMPIPEEFYSPLPDWLPCTSHQCERPDFDFFAFYYRDVVHTNSLTMENAWLDEAARLDPFSYNIAINEDVGRRMGLATGDLVDVENEGGRRVSGRLYLTQAIHPEGLGIGACAGHWADTMPVAKGKGVFFNDLLEVDWEHASPTNLNLDVCAKVKVTKAETAPA